MSTYNNSKDRTNFFEDKETDQQPKPLRRMPSWIEYGVKPIDRTKYLIGEGFMEIGGIVMLIGQSYAGKSTLVAQVCINIAIGETWLCFKVDRPLRIMVVQAEDSDNKLGRMGRMFKRMALTKDQIALARKNTAVLTIRDLQDKGAIDEIERHALVFKPDIIVINPLTSYLSGGVYKDDAINRFLRVDLTAMLDRVRASAIVVHHPPKPIVNDKEQKDLTAYELQYAAAGMASLTNVARGNMFLVHVDGDVFKLTVGKGFEDLGMKTTSFNLRRSKELLPKECGSDDEEIMLWEVCDQDQAEEADQNKDRRKANKKAETFVPFERILKLLKPTQKYSPPEVRQLVKKHLNRGVTLTNDGMKELVREKKLNRTEEHNPKGQAHVWFHLPTLLEPTETDPGNGTGQ